MAREFGQRITNAQRHAYAKKVRELLANEPDLSVKELVARTGAPYSLCNFLRKQQRDSQQVCA